MIIKNEPMKKWKRINLLTNQSINQSGKWNKRNQIMSEINRWKMKTDFFTDESINQSINRQIERQNSSRPNDFTHQAKPWLAEDIGRGSAHIDEITAVAHNLVRENGGLCEFLLEFPHRVVRQGRRGPPPGTPHKQGKRPRSNIQRLLDSSLRSP